MASRSVGLLLFTEIANMGLVAVLRERGHFDFEKMKPESWRGGCQVTAHGKVEANENFLVALARETHEELGGDFACNFWRQYSEKMVEIYRIRNEHVEVVTFAAKIDCSLLKKIRMSPESGSIRFLPRHGLGYIRNMEIFSKETGVIDRSIIVMFPDEEAAVAEGFAHFSP